MTVHELQLKIAENYAGLYVTDDGAVFWREHCFPGARKVRFTEWPCIVDDMIRNRLPKRLRVKLLNEMAVEDVDYMVYDVVCATWQKKAEAFFKVMEAK